MSNLNHPTKLLIVDDHIEIRNLLKLTFNYGKYQILEADNGNQALSIILSEKPDVVLLDIMMPGEIDGLDVCNFIKSSTLNQCKVILLSAKGQKEDFQKGLEVGANVYITKPFSPLALIELVEKL